jgi:Cdc6-like AAA superfamily ATPase
MDKLMKEYGEKILGHDPNQPGNYYYGRDGDGKFKIGNSKDNAETVTVEDAIKRLAEYEATKE